MKFRTAGTDYHAYPLPLFATAEEDAAAAAAAAGKPAGQEDGKEAVGSVFDAGKAFEGLEADNLDWLQKQNLATDPKALAKHAFNQEKLLGSAIRVPGKDAPKEEIDAFLNKLGRPETADKYELKAPEKMPEGLPYDGEFAKDFRTKAHELGLTQAQAAALHDMYVGRVTQSFAGQAEAAKAAQTDRANKAVEELEKIWGPLDGTTAMANLEIADKVFTHTKGGDQFLAALQDQGLIGPNKEILDARIAPFIAGIGGALYQEDNVLRGDPSVVGNIFDEKAPEFNVTEQMKLAKADPARALSLIRAAGKKPEDFHLPANFGA